MKEAEGVEQGNASLMDEGPGHPEVRKRVEQWHKLIRDSFYDCSLEVFRDLADLYVEDSRFTEHYEKARPGLSRFIRAAIHTYCDRWRKSENKAGGRMSRVANDRDCGEIDAGLRCV